jgi:hypothetical protein
MKISYIVKLNFLVLALLVVIFAMSKLRSGVSDGVAMILGMQPPSQAPAPGTVITTLDWCDTRIKALIRPGRPALEQVKLDWIWKGEPPEKLNFISVEKWFGRYCRVQIERVDPDQLGTVGPALEVHFIKGEPETLRRSVAGVYQWRQEIFRSHELDQALVDLEALPHGGAPTTR